jgi:CubicO group peptidase (beta-lactamase class C family)
VSISKVVTAAGVLRLVQAGAADLDADARDYAPRALRSDDPVTLRQLLTHTAGLAPIGRTRGRAHCRAAPATAWTYGNRGYGIVQRIIEARTGEPFAQFMAGEVFAPLGMRSSGYRRGHPPLAACGLWASAHDLGRFVAAIVSDAAWLAPELRRELVRPQPFGGVDHPFMALGLRLRDTSAGALAHHGGAWRTSTAQVACWPERRAGVVVLGHGRPVAPIARALAAVVAPESATPTEAPPDPAPGWVLGRYRADDPGAAPAAWFRLGRSLRVSMFGSRLFARGRWGVFRRGRTLYPTGPDRFAYLDGRWPVDVAFRRRGDEVLLFVSSPIGVLTRR